MGGDFGLKIPLEASGQFVAICRLVAVTSAASLDHSYYKRFVPMPKHSSPIFLKQPTAFDCFAGCGGMTEGLRQAGFDVVGAIEKDNKACSVYAANHPRVRLWEADIQSLSVAEIQEKLGILSVDLLGGCPPCQGFSTLRTYNGSKRVRDKQNDLIFEFQRLALGLLPKHVMMENVPALYHDSRFAEFRASLENSGYYVRAAVLDVQRYGVPQRRRRLIMIASRIAPIDFCEPSIGVTTVRQAIGHLPEAGRSGDPLHDFPEKRSQSVQQRIALVPQNGGSRSDLPKHLSLKCHQKTDGFRDVYGRMSWDNPAPTITTGCFNPSKGRFLHPTANRSITLREAALLQSFPARYDFLPELGKVKIATLIGNALPPRFIRMHAERIRLVGYSSGGGAA